MINVYLVAIAPLLIALTAAIVVLPIGLHYADKERAERERRVAAEALRRQAFVVWSSTVHVLSPIAGTAEAVPNVFGTEIGQSQESKAAPAARPVGVQPVGKLAA